MSKFGRRVLRLSRRVPHKIASLAGVQLGASRELRRRRDSWEQRWGDAEYRAPFEIGQASPSVCKAVDDGWFLEGMRALDIGCGAGYNAAWLAQQGLEVVGIDFSHQVVERAQAAFAGIPNLTFDVVDVVDPGAYPQSFDVLVDRGCFHGIDRGDRRKYLDNLDVWTRPRGRFLLIWRNKGDSSDKVIGRARTMLEPSFFFRGADTVDLAGMYSDVPLPAMAMRFTRSD